MKNNRLCYLPPISFSLIGMLMACLTLIPGHPLANALHPVLRIFCAGVGLLAFGISIVWIALIEVVSIKVPSLKECFQWVALAAFLLCGSWFAPNQFSPEHLKRMGALLALQNGMPFGAEQLGNISPECLPSPEDGSPVEIRFETLLRTSMLEQMPTWMEGRVFKVRGICMMTENKELHIARLMMFCCMADAMPVGIRMAGISETPAEGQWLEVEGSLKWPVKDLNKIAEYLKEDEADVAPASSPKNTNNNEQPPAAVFEVKKWHQIPPPPSPFLLMNNTYLPLPES